MEDGFTLPIGGDLSPLQEAFAQLIAEIRKLGQQIGSSFGQTNAAISRSVSSMGTLNQAVAQNTAIQQANATAAASTGQRIMALGKTAVAAARIFTGVSQTLGHVSSIMTALSSDNFGTMLSNATRLGSGFKKAISSAFQALQRVGRDKSFWKIAAGTAAAIGGILALRTAFRTVRGVIRLVGSTVSGVFRGIIAGARRAAAAVGSAFRGIASLPGRIFGGFGRMLPLGGLLSAAGAVALLVTQLRGASSDAAIFEDLTVSVEHFTGSVQTARKDLAELAKFALKTPFETIDVQQVYSGLLGSGIKGDVVGMTKDLAALAKDGEQLAELGDALGKGFAKGKFQTEELNKFLERQINLIPALQAQIGLTGPAFTKAIEKGLRFEDVTAAIASMSREGGQFFGLLERRSQTFTGLASTLKSAWTDLRKAFATPFNDALKPILVEATNGITGLMEGARQLGERIGRAVLIAFSAFKTGTLGTLISTTLNVGALTMLDTLARGFRGLVAFLATTLPPILDSAFSKLTNPRFWTGLSQFVKGIGMSLAAEIRGALPGADKNQLALNRQGAALNMEAGGLLMKLAGGRDFGEEFKKAMIEGAAAFREAAAGAPSKALTEARGAMGYLTGELGKLADQIAAKSKEGTKLKEGTASPVKPQAPAGFADVMKSVAQPAVMSLARIGGGGFASTVMSSLASEAKRQTRILTDIANNTAKGAGKQTAVYA